MLTGKQNQPKKQLGLKIARSKNSSRQLEARNCAQGYVTSIRTQPRRRKSNKKRKHHFVFIMSKSKLLRGLYSLKCLLFV